MAKQFFIDFLINTVIISVFRNNNDGGPLKLVKKEKVSFDSYRRAFFSRI
jgi:hypothetical protein